jgi:hypothetical protein
VASRHGRYDRRVRPRGPRPRAGAGQAIEELREAVHGVRHEVSEPALTEHQRALLTKIVRLCPDPSCSGECSGGWLRFLGSKDRAIARKLAAAGLTDSRPVQPPSSSREPETTNEDEEKPER